MRDPAKPDPTPLSWLALTAAGLLAAGCSLDFDRFLAVDGGAEDGGTLSAPTLAWPWNGFDTGTAREPAAVVSVRPRRPTFRWQAVAGATAYEVQIGETCDGWPEPSCAVEDVRLSATASTNEFTPVEDLPAAVRDPSDPFNRAASGARYFWRVRACDDEGCSTWSTSRYVDVGRLPDDYDGDGYSDLLVGEPTSESDADAGAVYVYGGGDGGLDQASPLRVDGDGEYRFGAWVAAAGDVNGDGFADALVVSAEAAEADPPPRAFLLLGSVDGLATRIDDATLLLTPEPGALQLRPVGVGDVNGDGFDDVVIGAPSMTDATGGRAYVFYGSASGLPSVASAVLPAPMVQPGSLFGFTVAGIGDIDGDGYPDVAISALSYNDEGSRAGRVHVYFGGHDGLASNRRVLIPSPSGQGMSFFGYALAGRGEGELFASALLHDEDGVPNVGIVYRLRAASPGRFEVVDFTHCGPAMEAEMRCGSSLSLGDIRGDRELSLAIGAQGQSSSSALDAGVAHLVNVSTSLAPTLTLEVDHDQATVRFAEQVHASADFDGDGRRDVVMSARRYSDALGAESGAAVVFLGRALTEELVEPILIRAPEASLHAWFGASVAGF